jgi:4-hydroxy-tetrahydrodipicolinate synthase
VAVFSGDDGLTWPMMALGAAGVVSVASNVLPAELSRLVDLAKAQEMEAARSQHERLSPLFRALFLEPNPQPVKAAMHLRGLIPSAACRLPMMECSKEVRAVLAEELAHFPA